MRECSTSYAFGSFKVRKLNQREKICSGPAAKVAKQELNHGEEQVKQLKNGKQSCGERLGELRCRASVTGGSQGKAGVQIWHHTTYGTARISQLSAT